MLHHKHEKTPDFNHTTQNYFAVIRILVAAPWSQESRHDYEKNLSREIIWSLIGVCHSSVGALVVCGVVITRSLIGSTGLRLGVVEIS